MTKKHAKSLGAKDRNFATLAPAKFVETRERFKPHPDAPICNASMPNAPKGYVWPWLATPPMG